MEAHFADEFTYQVWPSSMRPADHNQRIGKQAFIDRFKQYLEGWVDTIGVSKRSLRSGSWP